jgi:hypothetical protein
MSRKRKTIGPATPMEIARRRAAERERDRDPASWGIAREALDLTAYVEVAITGEGRGGGLKARRQDVFALLHARGKLSQRAHEAVRRLQGDIAVLHRTGLGVIDFTPRVDSSRKPEAFNDARRRAASRIEAALRLTGPASARLLAALCEADVVLGRAGDWRVVVQRETGERLADGQGAILRAACENLAGAYSMLDRGGA